MNHVNYYFCPPQHGDYDQIFSDLRTAGYGFWFDLHPTDREEQERYERDYLTPQQPKVFLLEGDEITKYSSFTSTFEWAGALPLSYEKVLLGGPSGAWRCDPFTKKLVTYLPPGSAPSLPPCPVHSFVETGTLVSWCRCCERDAYWDKSIAGWRVG